MTAIDPHQAPDRIPRFAQALDAAGFAAAVISHPRDVLYLAGTAQPSNLLVVPGLAPILFARRFVELTRDQTHIKQVVAASGIDAVRQQLESLGIRSGRIGLGLDALPALLYRKTADTFTGYELDDVSGLLAWQRAVKSAAEVDALRAAACLFEVVHAVMTGHVRAGIAEHELAGEVARALRRAGHDGVQFYRRWDATLHSEGAIASGENLWAVSGQAITITGVGLGKGFPFGASRRILQEEDLVNIDLGLVRDGYHADMARTSSAARRRRSNGWPRQCVPARMRLSVRFAPALKRAMSTRPRASTATIQGRGRHRSPRCPRSPMNAGHFGLDGTPRTVYRDPERTQCERCGPTLRAAGQLSLSRGREAPPNVFAGASLEA